MYCDGTHFYLLSDQRHFYCAKPNCRPQGAVTEQRAEAGGLPFHRPAGGVMDIGGVADLHKLIYGESRC